MSASLVGSEMCIRDRARGLPWLPKPRHLTGSLPGEAAPWLSPRVLVRPVSYTHLTLPTICSV
eukprot:6457087-Alexandrium_andersonii.AAC.1